MHSYAQSSLDEYEDEQYDEEVVQEEEESNLWLKKLDDAVDTSAKVHYIDIKNDSFDIWKSDKRYLPIKNFDSTLKSWQNRELAKQQRETNKGLSFLAALLSSNILGIILWALGISLILYILWQVIGNKGFFTRRPKSAIVDVPLSPDEQYLRSDFDSLLADAKATGNYRLGSRYLFLKLLANLQERSLLQFTIDKTNSTYLNELPPAVKPSFRKIASYYEYGWYGSNALTKEQFLLMEDAVKNLIKF